LLFVRQTLFLRVQIAFIQICCPHFLLFLLFHVNPTYPTPCLSTLCSSHLSTERSSRTKKTVPCYLGVELRTAWDGGLLQQRTTVDMWTYHHSQPRSSLLHGEENDSSACLLTTSSSKSVFPHDRFISNNSASEIYDYSPLLPSSLLLNLSLAKALNHVNQIEFYYTEFPKNMWVSLQALTMGFGAMCNTLCYDFSNYLH
jgi:hypothetical protein